MTTPLHTGHPSHGLSPQCPPLSAPAPAKKNGLPPVTLPSATREETASPGQQTGAGAGGRGPLEPGQPSLPRAPAALPRAQTLPTELLYQIFGYLALSTHNQCALVCHHWRRSLPDDRQRLLHWLQQHRPVLNLQHPYLAPGYSSRSAPWLTSLGHPLLPELERQHQQLVLLHERALCEARPDVQQQAQDARRLLSGQVLYSLHQQMTAADQLSLSPIPIRWAESDRLRLFEFSPCSRWLAMLCAGTRDTGCVLRLYGWMQGSWQGQDLFPPVATPARLLRFPCTPADSLLSAHGNRVQVWKRCPGTRHWCASPLCQAHKSYAIRALISMGNGDVITLCCKQHPEAPGSQLLFSRYLGEARGWAPSLAVVDPLWPLNYAFHAPSCLLALATCSPSGDDKGYRNEIHIWHQSLRLPHTAGWRCQTSAPGFTDSCLKLTQFSPDGRHLLGLLHNGQMRLWTRDARHRLHETHLIQSCTQLPVAELRELAHFRSDGKQLAVACSPHQIQFWNENPDGRWTPGDLISTPDGEASEDALRYILLSGDGQTLVRVGRRHMLVCRRSAGRREWLVQRQTSHNGRFPPQACLLGATDAIASTAQDPDLSLCIHGLNSQGQLVEKVRMATSVPLGKYTPCSPDGLSLLLGTASRPPCLLQLTGSAAVPPARPPSPHQQ